MSVEAYTSGRTLLRTQHHSDSFNPVQEVGKEVAFANGVAIQLDPECALYKQIVYLWTEMWTGQSAGVPIFFAPQCVTMTRQRWEALLKNKEEEHWVSWKSNGERFTLLITSLKYSSERVCVMINRRMNMFLVELAAPLSYYDGTILTGDLLYDSKTKTHHFELDDIQAWQGILVGGQEKAQRIQHCQTVVNSFGSQKGTTAVSPFSIGTKPWYPLKSIGKLLAQAQLFYLLEGYAQHSDWRTFWAGIVPPDGLIVQKNNAILGVLTNENIIKIKPREARTRDWLSLVHSDEGRVDLYSFVGAKLPSENAGFDLSQYRFDRKMWWRRMKSQSIVDTLSPFTSESGIRNALQMKQLSCHRAEELHDSIIEWAPDFATQLWHPIKKRDHEKMYANHDDVLVAEEKDFQEGALTVDEIIGSFGEGREQQSCHSNWRDLVAVVCTSGVTGVHLKPPTHLQYDPDLVKELRLQWDDRNAIKQVLPNFIHLHLPSEDNDDEEPPIFPTLTKYERAQVIAVEAQRLSNGGEALVPVGNSTSVIEIAERTLFAGTIPGVLNRPLPNGDTVQKFVHCFDAQWNMCNNRNIKYNN